MKKSTRLFWVDATLAGLLGLTLVTVPMEIFSHSGLHLIPGLLLMAGAGLHLALHRDWIEAVLQRYAKMPAAARQNAWIDLGLGAAYLACGGLGLVARGSLLVFSLHGHIFFAIVHILSALGLLTLQAVHLIRHWKWIRASWRSVFRSNVEISGPA